MAGLARLPPGLKVVAAANSVEAGVGCLDRLTQQIIGWELLVSTEMEIAHGRPSTPRGADSTREPNG